ncbi:DUF6574 domain-containing protein [Lapidilactobacillus wuchangensis]|uniref:DUF6574 domain-containing protein n=1 Tax=Lapidilactobacillus wuchangensis TaxID=2486001 RepID=UPI000F774440|nr:DUF6574 domain-containing protein [Lapidilactobacillus wuchangensis]
METCPNCGHELADPSVEFCPNCGFRLTNSVQQTTAADDQSSTDSAEANEATNAASQDTTSDDSQARSDDHDQADDEAASQADQSAQPKAADEQSADNDDDEDDYDDDDYDEPREPSAFEVYCKNYFKELNQNIRHPQIRHESSNYHGLINLGLIALLMSFAIARFFGKTLGTLLSGLSSAGLNLNTEASSSPLPLWGYVFIGILLAFAIRVFALFLYQRVVLHESISFLSAINELFIPTGLAVYLSVLALILSLILAPSMTLIVIFCLPFLLVNIAFVGSLWIFSENHPDQQRFYFVVVTLVLTSLVMLIFGRLLMSNVISQLNLPSMMSRMFGGSF